MLQEKVYFLPDVDGKVLPKASGDLVKEKNFAKKPYIIGCNSTEGDGLLSMLAPGDFVNGFTEEEAKMVIMTPVSKYILFGAVAQMKTLTVRSYDVMTQ